MVWYQETFDQPDSVAISSSIATNWPVSSNFAGLRTTASRRSSLGNTSGRASVVCTMERGFGSKNASQ